MRNRGKGLKEDAKKEWTVSSLGHFHGWAADTHGAGRRLFQGFMQAWESGSGLSWEGKEGRNVDIRLGIRVGGAKTSASGGPQGGAGW